MPLFKNCVTCDKGINFDKDELCICDRCCLVYHSQCSGLSREDIKLLASGAKQRPAFHCNKCISERSQISELLQTISDLQAELRQLKQEKEDKTYFIEDVVNEINDRRRREKNIIIYKLEESTNDGSRVKEIIKKVAPSICVDDIGITRLGKSGPNRPAPIKVVLHSKDDVVAVLRNKRNLKTMDIDVVITTDNTKLQQEYFMKVRAELEQRKTNGERNLSIRKNFLSLKDYILANDVDFVGISETFLDASYTDNYVSLNNYNLIRSDRLTFGGGVAIYLKACFNFKKIEFDVKYTSIEHSWLMVNIDKLKVAFGVVYVPPSANIEFFNDLSDIIEQVYLKSHLIVLTGDLNVNLLCEDSSESRRLLTLLSNFELIQLIKEPTRITPKSATLLDVICVSNSLNINSCGTNLKNLNINSFTYDAERVNWQEINQCENINTRVHMLNECILELFDIHAPFVKIKPRKKYNPYITDTIKEMIRLREKAHKNFFKNRTEFILHSNKSNANRQWYHLQKLGVRTKRSTRVELPAQLQNPTAINEYFLNFAENSTIDPNVIRFFNGTMRCENTTFTFNEITEHDIYTALKNSSSKAYGPDHINLTMLVLIIPHCLDVVLKLFNDCLRNGICPEIWKTADIIPLVKVTNPSTYNDLRPISLLSPFAKVFEKIIASQITRYFENSHITPVYQSAYRKKYSSNTALMKVINDISHSYDKSLCTILILLDQSKAFDLVNHELLIAKLKHLGFDDNSVSWFTAYLNCRSQRVRISHRSSSFARIKRGVPQGSVLGPLLFSAFTFDLPTSLHQLRYHLYADDLQLYIECSTSNIEETIDVVNSDLLGVQTWCQNNGLRLNPAKSTAICVGPRLHSELVSSFQLRLMSESIPWSTTVKT
ncbi:uncharacterized protein LOC116167944 [Photinus pyralis]|uniref:uncharacterized protein LOC116167944 n=1 Tax=Photinus pyralis TaxID=7054 RepID=UPI0012671C50|nr:uncharacterized protein LOC116167944 [Photinus pyralis]